MNKNGTKIIIVVLCLAGAAVAIMWNLGVIGGGKSTQGSLPAAANSDPSKAGKPDTKSNAATGDVGQLQKVNY